MTIQKTPDNIIDFQLNVIDIVSYCVPAPDRCFSCRGENMVAALERVCGPVDDPWMTRIACGAALVSRGADLRVSRHDWCGARKAARCPEAVMRSGDATGADTAFERRCDRPGGAEEIRLPCRLQRPSLSTAHSD